MSTIATLKHQHIMSSSNNNNNQQNEFDLLDIFSTDIDFEKAYDMYNNLQQKNALGSFEQLQKVQQLNQQYTSNLINPQSSIQFPDQFAYERAHILNGPQSLHQQQGLVNNYLMKNYSFNNAHQQQQHQQQQQQQQQHQDDNVAEQIDEDEELDDEDFDQFFTNTESNALEKFLDNLANPISTGDPLQFYNSNNGANSGTNHEIDFNFEMHTMKVPQHLKPRHQSSDNLLPLPIPLPPQSHHLQHQHQHVQNNQRIPSSSSSQQYSTQSSSQLQLQQQQHIQLKKDLTEAFTNPSSSTTITTNLSDLPSPNEIMNHNNDQFLTNPKINPTSTTTTTTTTNTSDNSNVNKRSSKHLITPPTSGDELKKRISDEDDDEDESDEEEDLVKDDTGNTSDSSGSAKPLKKRRRSSNKPLLSLEQKRLNHSHSEQKRRQLCKLAYLRCLELIIDLEAFSKLPELNENERKSKRARINKDGLPNLSKHNALIRISNEMILIKSMNENLRKLIDN